MKYIKKIFEKYNNFSDYIQVIKDEYSDKYEIDFYSYDGVAGCKISIPILKYNVNDYESTVDYQISILEKEKERTDSILEILNHIRIVEQSVELDNLIFNFSYYNDNAHSGYDGTIIQISIRAEQPEPDQD